jgi:DNA-binding response OmpR family regulator
LTCCATPRVDCIVLDAGPPGQEGLEMCRRLRDADDETPIILLTAPAGIGQRVQGLEAGADDCLGRPFVLEERWPGCGAIREG